MTRSDQPSAQPIHAEDRLLAVSMRIAMTPITPGNAGAMAPPPARAHGLQPQPATCVIHGAGPVLLQVVESTGELVFAAPQVPGAPGMANATAFIAPHGPAALKTVQLPLTPVPKQSTVLGVIELISGGQSNGVGLRRGMERLQCG